jgi:hypothetical protein
MPTRANIAKINGITIAAGADVTTDRHILLGTQTASSSATLSFSGINSHRSDVLRSSFDVLEFRFTNIHPATDGTILQFQVNASGQTGFNEVMTTTQFETYHNEAGSDSALAYRAAQDQAQGTAYQAILTRDIGNDNDQSASGIMTLYNPSSTTYVKHFTAVGNGYYYQEYSLSFHTAGYINVTAAIDEISFNMNVGNIDAGVIKMYGIAKA